MAKKNNAESLETSTSEIQDNINLLADDVVDTSAPQEEIITEESPVVKKKTASRKKKPEVVGAVEIKVKKTPVKRDRSTRIDPAESSPPAPVMKAFWGVFNPMMVQVAQYNYADEAVARKAAADLTEKKKTPHFVQLIKKVI